MFISQQSAFHKDIERIRNKKAENGLFSIIRDINTIKGRLVLYIEILALAIQSMDKKVAYDVFWAIESTELYQQVRIINYPKLFTIKYFISYFKDLINFIIYIKKLFDFDIPKPESKKTPQLVYDNKLSIKKCIDKVIFYSIGLY